MNRIIALICFSFLVGCGGGGGGSKAPTPPPASSSSVSSSSSSVVSSSASENSSIPANTVSPLPIGSGTFSFYFRQPYYIDEETGIVTATEGLLDRSYTAADIAPDGTVIAIKDYDVAVDQINPLTGAAITLFDAPEPLSSVAVSLEGVVVAVSRQSEFQKWAIYRFSLDGEVLSKSALPYRPSGIDFDSSGRLIGVLIGGAYEIDPETGENSILNYPYVTPSSMSDIDIDENDILRSISGGDLLVSFNLQTGFLVNELPLQYNYFSFSPIVRR